MTIDKELLFKPRLPEADVEVEGIGTVRVRAVTRQEAKQLQALPNDDLRDLHMLAIGLIDPRLSVSEVKRWAEASPPSELEPVAMRIAELSGLLDKAPKEAMQNFQANPEDEFRILPSAETLDDGGRAAGADE